MRSNTLFYQIDMVAASSGKHVAATKRRVRWRFGIANPEAIAAGKTGVECRGREHEVTLVWSLTSGKRLVLADQKEVHFSQGRRTEGKFSTSWEMRGNNVLTINAHAAPPLKSKVGWKQFDLLINGYSFDSLPRIYELGMSSASNSRSVTTRPSRTPASYSNYSVDGNAEREWAQKLHEQERVHDMDRYSERQQQAYVSERRSAAMDRNDPTQASQGYGAPAPDFAVNHSATVDLVSDSSLPMAGQDLISAPPSLMEQQQQQQTTQSAPQLQTYDQFQPRDEFDPNQPPSYEQVWSSILDAYDQTAIGSAQNAPNQTLALTNGEDTSADNNPSADPVEKPKLTINTQMHLPEEQIEFFGNSSPTGVDEVNSAFSSLVNLDDLTSPAEAQKKKLTMMSEEKQKKTRKGSSTPLPPKAAGWNLGPSPTLSELKAIQTAPPTEKKEIMSTPQQAAYTAAPAAGALVVYGSNQNMGYNNYGPPPLQYTQGFGVGANVVTHQSPHAQPQQPQNYNYNSYPNQVHA